MRSSKKKGLGRGLTALFGDQKASEKMLHLLLTNKTQTFVTSIKPPRKQKQLNENMAVFHVKHGRIKKMIK